MKPVHDFSDLPAQHLVVPEQEEHDRKLGIVTSWGDPQRKEK